LSISNTDLPQLLALLFREFEKELLPYQIKYLYDQTKYVGYRKAVRTGITYTHSLKSLKKRLLRHPHQRPSREIFASKNRVTAGEYLGYHRRWAGAINEACGTPVIPLDAWTTEKAIYPGGEVLIVSSDPNSFRGMEGDVTLDEFAFHEQQDQIYAAAQSRMQWLSDGQMTLISSSSHPETTFERLMHEWERDKTGAFSVHRTTIDDAVREGLALKVPGPHASLLRKKQVA
jgi:phage FluMu gp28-like protein